MIDSPQKTVTVLIVDDNHDNLRVLGGMLQEAGYQVRAALSGALALQSIRSSAPDLVLLDICMPEMDGYEVCRLIKAEPKTREVPIIFISALNATDEKVSGFKMGAVDYIVKPFQIEEVLARVKTHTELFDAHRALQSVRDDLEQQVEERTRELKISRDRIQQAMQREHALTELLNLSLGSVSLNNYLDQALQLLNDNLQWDFPETRNAIYLIKWDEDPHLHMVASRQFSAEDQTACKRIPLGYCACGQAMEQADMVVCKHANPYPSTQLGDHGEVGHLCVPLVNDRSPLGLLVHCFSCEQDEDEQLRAFLLRVADVLSMGISWHYANERIEYLAYHDELTNLPNRRLFTDRLDQELRRAKRHNERGAVLFLDLDRFKNLNDVLGHTIGDEFLVRISERLQSMLRMDDSLCRWGGDEFLVLLPVLSRDLESAISKANLVAEKLIRTVAKPIEIQNHDLQLTASIGIAMYPNQTVESEDLIKYADTAMYQAKQSGRNAIRFYETTMQEIMEHRLLMERDLRQALAKNELFLLFQPQVLADGSVIGVETLARWEHPSRGLVMPAEFITIAEDSGLIVAIGEWVLATSLEQLRIWQHDVPEAKGLDTVSVNVSSRQFHEQDFTEKVERAIVQSGIDPQCVELEVTEGMLLEDIEDTVLKMTRLRDFGLRFAIDDFGTGYSSLSYLKRLPLNRLKIDQSFVRDVYKDPQDAAIVSTIIAMARNLNLDVIAEGVESPSEVEFLHQAGCESFQGYYFGRPMKADGIVDLLVAPRKEREA
ncbi:MAG: EAL domain-containing protein [Candidatus Thiodiazotropha endolucinida]